MPVVSTNVTLNPALGPLAVQLRIGGTQIRTNTNAKLAHPAPPTPAQTAVVTNDPGSTIAANIPIPVTSLSGWALGFYVQINALAANQHWTTILDLSQGGNVIGSVSDQDTIAAAAGADSSMLWVFFQ